VHAVVAFNEVIERAEEQHHVRGPVGIGETTGVAHLGPGERRTGMGARLFHVPRREIEEMHLVPAAGQPARVEAGASSHVEDARGGRRQAPLEDVLRSCELDDTRPLEQAPRLEAGLVEPLDVLRVAHGR
jgi:hypothetical protein